MIKLASIFSCVLFVSSVQYGSYEESLLKSNIVDIQRLQRNALVDETTEKCLSDMLLVCKDVETTAYRKLLYVSHSAELLLRYKKFESESEKHRLRQMINRGKDIQQNQAF